MTTLPPISDSSKGAANAQRQVMPSLYVSGPDPVKISEYTEKYPRHQLVPTRAIKPKLESVLSGDPFQGDTTSRNDYIAHPVQRTPRHKTESFVKPDGAMYLSTSYATEFQTKAIAPAKSIRPKAQKLATAPFEGVATYRGDYTQWELPKRDFGSSAPLWKPSEEPFSGDTHYRSDFAARKIAPSQSCKPVETAWKSSDPFDSLSNYKQEFKQHEVPVQRSREKVTYKPSSAPFEGLSTQKSDFVSKKLIPTISCKPARAAYNSDASFEDATTFRSDYQGRQTERFAKPCPEPYKPPIESMDMGTNYARDFVNKPISPAKMKKPKATRHQYGKFDGEATYKSDFQAHKPIARQSVYVKQEYVPSEGAFEGTSNYKLNYHQHPINRVTAFKPVSVSNVSDTPFEGRTNYQEDFGRRGPSSFPTPLQTMATVA